MKVKLTVKSAEIYLNLLLKKGDEGLYRHVVAAGVKRSIKFDNPEIEILDLSEAFFTLYRRTGEEDYSKIGRIMRKAAHTLYRQFLRINADKVRNERFLQAVN